MTWIWLNVPLAVIFTAFAVGLPLWVILKHPADAPETSPDQVPCTGTRRCFDPRRRGSSGIGAQPAASRGLGRGRKEELSADLL